MIVLSPLASLAMYSKIVAHVVTGECSGDCNICGCSLESRANHTCCCAKKKQANMTENVSGTCNTLKVIVVEPKKTCCSKSANRHREAADDEDNYSTIKSVGQHDDHKTDTVQKTDSNKNETVYKCGCPCGKGKLLALNGFGANELLPISPSERIELQHVETLFADLSHRLVSRHSEPPEPPPRLPLIS
jgi:hypothetical protein